jgi:diadenosine tetraphosphate (Ap4A) HIT family hydrolase
MANRDEERDCLFCQVLRVSSDELPWHDKILARAPDVGAVIAGLGAFVPGYVLVFPEEHTESTLRVSLRERFLEFADRTVSRVTAVFGPATIFEHGSCTAPGARRSACLEHAHLHVLPGSYKLAGSMQQWPVKVLDNIGYALKGSQLSEGYLYLREPSGAVWYAPDPRVSQYFRRKVAAYLNTPDEWDYLMFPRLDNVRETIHRFEELDLE